MRIKWIIVKGSGQLHQFGSSAEQMPGRCAEISLGKYLGEQVRRELEEGESRLQA